MTPEEIIRRVLYRDALMLVLDKPAGHPVHRGPKNAHGDEPLDRFFGELRFGLPRNPELAHRLDRDTSGCLVLGRHRQALARLADLFKAGQVSKTYWAVVEGGPEAEEGVIDLPLGRLDESRGWWMKVDPDGQPAETRWKVMGRSADGALAWLAMSPITGRTHQLRVHAKALGCPILGDAIYGSAPRFGGRGCTCMRAGSRSRSIRRSRPWWSKPPCRSTCATGSPPAAGGMRLPPASHSPHPELVEG